MEIIAVIVSFTTMIVCMVAAHNSLACDMPVLCAFEAVLVIVNFIFFALSLMKLCS